MARARVAPQDRGGGFRRGDRVDGVLEHQHAVGGGDGDGAAGAALADDHGDQRHAERQAAVGRAGDGLGLAALLRADAGVGAGGVDQREHRQAESVGEVHQPHGLAIALRLRHAEVVLDAALGVGALLVADHHHRAAAEAAEPAHDGRVLGEVAVAGQRREILDQRIDVVEAMRPVGMARDLRLLPGRELGIGVDERLMRLLLQLRRPLRRWRRNRRPPLERPELGDLALELGDRLLEIEIGANGRQRTIELSHGSEALISLEVGTRATEMRLHGDHVRFSPRTFASGCGGVKLRADKG